MAGRGGRSRVGRAGVSLVTAGLLYAVWPLARADTAAAPAAAPAAASMAAAAPWLARIQQAASSLSYQGTLMFSHGGVVSSARVLHVCSANQRVERIEMLDGRARLQYRHNDRLLTLWPGAKVAVYEPGVE